jgi:uncharacterized protein with GYD domain
MPTYITLINFTEQGMQNIKESPARYQAGKEAVEAAGGKYLGFYLTMGRYDAILIAEGPDDATVAQMLLMIAAQGNVRTETLRAFPEDEYREIVARLP